MFSTSAVLAATSGGLVHWTITTLSDKSPPSPFILFTSSSVTNFSWYNPNSTVLDSSKYIQTGHTKYCYTMLIPKVYNVCEHTVTADGRRNRCRLGSLMLKATPIVNTRSAEPYDSTM